MRLTGIELLDWIALRRVHEGGVAILDSGYVHWGLKVPCYLPEVFDRLADTELTSLLDVDFPAGPRQVVLTPRGLDRYQELTTKRGSPEDPEQSSGDCSVPLTGRHPRLRPIRGSGRSSVERTPRPAPGDRPVPRKTTQRRDEI